MSQTAATPQMPPTLKGPWPMGSLAFFAKDPLKFFDDYAPQYDGIFEITSLFFKIAEFKHFFIITDADIAKHILQENNRNYKKSYDYAILKLLLGEGLITSEGDFWRKQRRIIQPAFHRDRMAGFTKLMTDETSAMLKKWEAMPDKTVFNISRDLMALTLNIISKAMFSTDVNDTTEIVNRELGLANEKLIARVMDPLTLPLWIPTPSNVREKQSYAALKEIISVVIEKRRKSTERHDDLMAMLMEIKDDETGEMMSDEQIRDEVVTIFLAGHETTSVALAWLFHTLDENPEIETKLLAEAHTVLNGRTPVQEDLRQLEYTRMVIEETMRLYPSVWALGRHSIEDDVVKGYKIPKDSTCFISTYSLQRDPSIWPDPLKFIPERFTKENVKDRHRFAYLPFGGGPRLCIGNSFAMMEMQLALPMIVQRYKLHKPAGFTFGMDPLITLRPKPEIQMEITRR
jgi:cytochrome P450